MNIVLHALLPLFPRVPRLNFHFLASLHNFGCQFCPYEIHKFRTKSVGRRLLYCSVFRVFCHRGNVFSRIFFFLLLLSSKLLPTTRIQYCWKRVFRFCLRQSHWNRIDSVVTIILFEHISRGTNETGRKCRFLLKIWPWFIFLSD